MPEEVTPNSSAMHSDFMNILDVYNNGIQNEVFLEEILNQRRTERTMNLTNSVVNEDGSITEPSVQFHSEILRVGDISIPSCLDKNIVYNPTQKVYESDFALFKTRAPLQLTFVDTKTNYYLRRFMAIRNVIQTVIAGRGPSVVFNGMSKRAGMIGSINPNFNQERYNTISISRDSTPSFGNIQIYVCDQKGEIQYMHEFNGIIFQNLPKFMDLSYTNVSSHSYQISFDYKEWNMYTRVGADDYLWSNRSR
jgi:hypothetical protein